MTKTTRRAALGAIAAIAAVPASGMPAMDDPFLAAEAESARLLARWESAIRDEDDDQPGEDAGEACYAAHEAIAAAIDTEPATLAGHAARLEFLARNPWGDERDSGPVCGWSLESEEWQRVIVGALKSTAATLRELAKA